MGTTALSGLFASYFYYKNRKLQDQHIYDKNTLDDLQEGFYRTSLDGKQLQANRALVRLNGYTHEAEQLAAVNDIATEWYVDPTRRDTFKRLIQENGKVVNFISQIHRHKTREKIWISENAKLISNPDTLEPLYFEGTVREITQEIEYRKNQDRLEKISTSLPGGLFQVAKSPDGKFTTQYLSASFFKLLGTQPGNQFDNANNFLRLIHPEFLADYMLAFKDSEDKLEPLDFKFRCKNFEDEYIWLHIAGAPEKTDDGDIVWHGYVSNISQQVEFEKQIEKLAYFDTLTGLPKRSVFEDKLHAAIATCYRRNEYAACLFIDLDNFKTLNDTYGHESGDALLVEVAKRLQKNLRASDLAARFGGDEFTILIDNLGNKKEVAKEKASRFASKILAAFADPFEIKSREHFSSPSIGISLIDETQQSVDEIVKQADSAMYQAKKNGRNTYTIFSDNGSGDTAKHSTYDADLKTAVERNEFCLLFQPQINRSGQITGAEAFIRWQHPAYGTLLPSEFMPTAERNGTLIDINNWVIDTAIRQIAEWSENPATAHLELSINVSIQQLSTTGFCERLELLLDKSDIQRTKLTFEVAETMISRNIDFIRTQMVRVKKTGIRFSLDDYGTGNSSIANLNMLPFDEIKIDGSLISDLESDANNRSLIEGILGASKALNINTVAEHVSTKFHESYLRKFGCNKFQGYLYYPPVQLDTFNELIENSHGLPEIVAAS